MLDIPFSSIFYRDPMLELVCFVSPTKWLMWVFFLHWSFPLFGGLDFPLHFLQVRSGQRLCVACTEEFTLRRNWAGIPPRWRGLAFPEVPVFVAQHAPWGIHWSYQQTCNRFRRICSAHEIWNRWSWKIRASEYSRLGSFQTSRLDVRFCFVISDEDQWKTCLMTMCE